MATGDVTVFEEALAYLTNGTMATTDTIKVAICDNTTTPTAADPAPAVGSGGTTNYTEVGNSGSYTAGGETLDTLTNCVTEAGGTMTFDDTGASVTWTQNASNDTDAWWAIVYNDADANNRAICYIELGGPVNMATGALTITWNASGIFTIS
jgi:hypothetical protein